MSDKIKQILNLLSKTKESAKSASMDDLLKEIQELKALVITSMIQAQLSQVSNIVKDLKTSTISTESVDKPTVMPKDACDKLATMTTNKIDLGSKERLFLLHRLTPDFEYENSIDGNSYSLTKASEWKINYDFVDMTQDISGAQQPHKGVNPMMSCWIPESSITEVHGISENTGTWNELGADQKSNRYIIHVKPGKFTVYSELKQ